jgi:hypothetical protein
MNVAIFTDNDLSKVNGVTTTIGAVLEHAPADVGTRVYTCDARDIDPPEYRAFGATGVSVPFHRERKIYLPPLRRLRREAAADRIDVIHLTTPGPVGLAAMHVAARLRLPMVGSFDTDLAEYQGFLSRSPRLRALMENYVRWP